MIGFYGFNPAQNPATSRLFGPNVVDQGQQTFQQGWSQFKPFNEEEFAQQQAAAKAAALAAQSKQSQQPPAQYYIDSWNQGIKGADFKPGDWMSHMRNVSGYNRDSADAKMLKSMGYDFNPIKGWVQKK